jgi:hypothetical protein
MTKEIINQPEVRFFRLITGEDILAMSEEVLGDDFDNAHFLMENPLKVIYMTNPMNTNNMALSLMQWVFDRVCDEQEFKIYTTDILTTGTPNPEFLKHYAEAVIGLSEGNTQDESEGMFMEEDDMDEYLGEDDPDEVTELDDSNRFMNESSKRTIH